MKRTSLEMMIKAENIMGVYRNYDSQTNYRKIRIIRVAIEILISGIILLSSTYDAAVSSHLDPMSSMRLFTFHFSTLFSSCTIMISAIQNSGSYTIFIKNFVTVHQSLNTEPSKIYSRKFKTFFITTTAILCCCGVGVLPIRLFYRIVFQKRQLQLSLVLLLTTEIFSELRFSIEHVIFYIYIRMVHCLLKLLNSRISDLQDHYNEQEKKICVGRREVNNPVRAERMEEWATNYMLLVGCSKEIAACFSFQVNVTLQRHCK